MPGPQEVDDRGGGVDVDGGVGERAVAAQLRRGVGILTRRERAAGAKVFDLQRSSSNG